MARYVSSEILSVTAYSKRWAYLATTGTDLPTLATWDKELNRERRVLVPVDVQAFVATADGEQVTPVGGVLKDPEPFADLTSLSAGVHLHWALPDSLLSGRAAEDSTLPDFPRLPDRWVVVRTLSRQGESTVHQRGWVIDAATAGVAPLESYAGGTVASTGTVVGGGTTGTGPTSEPEVLDPLDAAARRSLLWTGTYAGAQGRFTFHDDLGDLAAVREAGTLLSSRACYLVAGWYAADDVDPLNGIGWQHTLEEVTSGLGWIVTRDGPDSDEEGVDPATRRAESRAGQKAPTEGTIETVTSTGVQVLHHEGLAPSGLVQVGRVAKTVFGRRAPSYRTLLHGAVLGVPVDGTVSGRDHRPASSSVTGAIGLDLDDVAAALAAEGLSSSTSSRSAAEHLMAAFTSGLLARIGSPDGLFDLDEHEHTETFGSVPGPPLPGLKPDRLRAEDALPTNPLTVGRKGRGARQVAKSPRIAFTGGVRGLRGKEQRDEERRDQEQRERKPQPPPSKGSVINRGASEDPASREVIKAAPRIFRPAAPLLGLRGVRPGGRHHHDGSHDASERLVCRRPGDIVTALTGIVEGQHVLPTLGSGAVPNEVLPLAREMVLLNGYDATWLASVGDQRVAAEKAVKVRLAGELLRLYGTDATYDGTGVSALTKAATGTRPRASGSPVWESHQARRDPVRAQLASALSAHSLLDGMAPSPVALTTWAQPWCPLFVEWEVLLEGRDDLDGWQLGPTDLEPAPAPQGAAPQSATVTRVLRGRAPLNTGVGKKLAESIGDWLKDEEKRDEQPGASQLSDPDEKALAELATMLGPLGVASASLDGVREQLLGIAYRGFVVRQKSAPDEDGLPEASERAVPLFGGTLTVTDLRLVDTFGRVLPVDVTDLATTSALEVPGAGSSIQVTPRLQHGARWLFRLVDPAHPITADPVTATEAWVDQVRPDLSVNPISGFLLPDHIDEACEVFDRDGHPLGQIGHDGVTNAVLWEPAPGRPVPPSAGPLDPSTPAHAQLAGRLAAGLVQADIEARTEAGSTEREHTALSAFLGVIDSTLWSVDTYAALGSPTIAGLVGRPLAIVRATLRLDAPSDLGEVKVTAPGGPGERRAAFEALRRHRFPVRLGELGRSDDATIGFFVDDDYSRFHVVDKVVAQVARESRRHRGHLGLLGATVTPEVSPIEHPYIHPEDTLLVAIGQVVRLTIVMVPGGRVHLTSGILPRKALGLADEWVTPGLSRLSPSMRVGPLLVDPAEIKLPLVASLGPDQVFTRRTGPLTWRDDPIVAATAAAYLPRLPHEAQEGWIRVTPEPTEE
ncbi:hypothetical protein [Ornithinimicrobium cryptoxanthini]|uniref:Uncharacterized protein n=1 Tax=Ornithinimicrobium cryptoxanthini TaxID=2934161 RepID=A0ABY4YFZ1_9MICO|nr:hypothetical protein [Ornithinimicrobium cryptoxanthini]USQ75529.1 hypothetical protein NF557_13030 [Ornithinimicrobium cryptoxanthini]